MTCGCLQNQIRQTLGTTWAPRREYACILRVNRQKISTPCTPSFSACVYCTTPFVWHIYACNVDPEACLRSMQPLMRCKDFLADWAACLPDASYAEW